MLGNVLIFKLSFLRNVIPEGGYSPFRTSLISGFALAHLTPQIYKS